MTPGKPSKITVTFPVIEISWTFKMFKTIMENKWLKSVWDDSIL